LRILGMVLHISSHKNLIICGNEKYKNKNSVKLPKINNNVFDRKMKRIGKIIDIFGPINSPYFSVKISGDVKNDKIREFKFKNVYMK
jgi:RNA-binding protein